MEETQEAPATIRREEAAQLMGVSVTTVDRWRRRGTLVDAPSPEAGPGVPPLQTREVYIYREHVDQIIMSRSAGATQ